eukprot:GHVU01041792.1.p1 GENE.GHVU01041792.1~~GHVU01041792.1.p1  ORF type:complete len:115 (+),score=2.95 GHVU01041792.1:384-728(+)
MRSCACVFSAFASCSHAVRELSCFGTPLRPLTSCRVDAYAARQADRQLGRAAAAGRPAGAHYYGSAARRVESTFIRIRFSHLNPQIGFQVTTRRFDATSVLSCLHACLLYCGSA